MSSQTATDAEVEEIDEAYAEAEAKNPQAAVIVE